MFDDNARPDDVPRLVYSGNASGASYEMWREEFGRRILATDFKPIGEGPFHRAITPGVLPKVKISASAGSAMTFTTLASCDDLAIMTSRNSPLDAVMGQRSLRMAANTYCLGDTGIRGAYMSQLATGSFSVLLIDRKTLLDLCPRAEDLIATSIAQDPGLAAMLRGYYDLVVRNIATLDPVAQSLAARHLIDLAALALGAHRDAAEEAKTRGLAAARFAAIKADILSRLAENDLSITRVAQRCRASPRYVQMLFEQAGTTFSEFVLDQRSLLAYRLLSNPLHGARKVSDIAHMSGFGDLSYFHRTFRRRFGMTPADARRQAGGNVM